MEKRQTAESDQPMCEQGSCGEKAYCAEAGECLAVVLPPVNEGGKSDA